ncbi:esterase [Xylophilus sp. Kf1]|nr:esterase [Xylophilus sp. Kf1]
MSEHIVVQMPEAAPAQLFLLFHGVDSTPHGLVPLGEQLAEAFPSAAVIAVCAPPSGDAGTGHAWFPVTDVTDVTDGEGDGDEDDDRAGRVAAALPGFVDTVRGFQRSTGAGAAQTALVGFSQGAIMALAATQWPGELLAGRVVALAGRFAGMPALAPAETTLHLIHGQQDMVIASAHTVAAAERWMALGGDVTADVIAGLGHALDTEMGDLVLHRLRTHVPRRIWEMAMASAGSDEAAGP